MWGAEEKPPWLVRCQNAAQRASCGKRGSANLAIGSGSGPRWAGQGGRPKEEENVKSGNVRAVGAGGVELAPRAT